MSLDLLNTEPESVPKEFIRGQTLEFVMELPKKVPENFFESTDLHARIALHFARVSEMATPHFGVVIWFPEEFELEPVVIGTAWDTNVATTLANLVLAVNYYMTHQVGIPFTMTATSVGPKMFLIADDPGSDKNDMRITPPFTGGDYVDAVIVNCLRGGGPSNKGRASFVLNADGEEGTTWTLAVNDHEASFKRETDMSLTEAAAGLAAAAMEVQHIRELVKVTSIGTRVVLVAKDEGVAGDDIQFTITSDSGAQDATPTLYGGIDGASTQAVTTTLASKIRLLGQAGASGLIADLNPAWEVGSAATKIRFYVENTDEWPLGPAEFDVTFVRTVGGEASSDAEFATGSFVVGGTPTPPGGYYVSPNIAGTQYVVYYTGSLEDLAIAVAQAINDDVNSPVTALATGTTVALTAKEAGVGGNAITLDWLGHGGLTLTPSGLTLSGGANAVSGSDGTVKKYRSLPVRIAITDGVT